MDPGSVSFYGAFLGAMLGLPGGFLLIEVIRAIVSRRQIKHDSCGRALESLLSSEDGLAHRVEYIDVANNRVSIWSFRSAPANMLPLMPDGSIAWFGVQAVGPLGAPVMIPAANESDAADISLSEVKRIKDEMGIVG
jgi:hypothetical protein